MKRPRKFPGLCGLLWIQTHPAVYGDIQMECEHQDGYWCRGRTSTIEDECSDTCERCDHKLKSK